MLASCVPKHDVTGSARSQTQQVPPRCPMPSARSLAQGEAARVAVWPRGAKAEQAFLFFYLSLNTGVGYFLRVPYAPAFWGGLKERFHNPGGPRYCQTFPAHVCVCVNKEAATEIIRDAIADCNDMNDETHGCGGQLKCRVVEALKKIPERHSEPWACLVLA